MSLAEFDIEGQQGKRKRKSFLGARSSAVNDPTGMASNLSLLNGDEKASALSALDSSAPEVQAMLKSGKWRLFDTDNYSSIREKFASQREAQRHGHVSFSAKEWIEDFFVDALKGYQFIFRLGQSNQGTFIRIALTLINDIFFAALYLVEAEYHRVNFRTPSVVDMVSILFLSTFYYHRNPGGCMWLDRSTFSTQHTYSRTQVSPSYSST